MSFSILTYNIHKGFNSGNRQFVLHRIREMLRELDVDVALLQEVQGEHQLHSQRIRHWPDTSQFEFLADQVWPHYAYGKNAIADGRHHGNAVLSKFPFQQWGNINLSPWRFASRSLLHGSVTLCNGIRLHLVCLHLGLLGVERRSQLRRLNQHLNQVMNEHDAVIIGGDFNDWTGRQVRRLLDPALQLQEAHRCHNADFARTFPAQWPLLQVDRLYFRGLELVDCRSLDNLNWRGLSDHLPLLARFELPEASCVSLQA
ncbi:MAG TPA: endonuclease/exonuclease/phosphatase family protein [Hyphomicrobiales bacterium]|nr:endonuclease/exonuclease/phosphatase family protein [Hyphomicrobiales bacterium]